MKNRLVNGIEVKTRIMRKRTKVKINCMRHVSDQNLYEGASKYRAEERQRKEHENEENWVKIYKRSNMKIARSKRYISRKRESRVSESIDALQNIRNQWNKAKKFEKKQMQNDDCRSELACNYNDFCNETDGYISCLFV